MAVLFCKSTFLGQELNNMYELVSRHNISSDGKFSRKCVDLLKQNTNSERVLLVSSCTAALEMSAILLNIQPGDEIIMPSFTFVSTANAFVLRGAKIVFVDIHPNTMNINENLIEEAITNKTKAIVPVHYGGVSCEMDKILEIAKKHNLFVIEDAAQCIGAKYKGKVLGAIGDIGCYSFHETKNISCGEGGAIFIQNETFIERAEIIREKGTNRQKFFKGEVDKYTWVDIGSSYLFGELQAAYLVCQLENIEQITQRRKISWDIYYKKLEPFAANGFIDLPVVPDGCEHNAHCFYIKVKNIRVRQKIISYLRDNEISAVFHYVPLHSSPMGKICGRFSGEDKYTTIESERLLRLPLFDGISLDDINSVVEKIRDYFEIYGKKILI